MREISFFDSNNACIGSSYFLEPLKCNIDTAPMKLLQIIVAGVFVADIDFSLSLLGLQGSSAKYPCVFCLTQLKDMESTWDVESPTFPMRTLENLRKAYQEYKANYLDISETQ